MNSVIQLELCVMMHKQEQNIIRVVVLPISGQKNEYLHKKQSVNVIYSNGGKTPTKSNIIFPWPSDAYKRQ